jgi:hypothetical protein
MIKTFLNRVWDYLTMPGEIITQSKYLSQATDTADLERRMREVQRARVRLQHL